MNHLKVADPTSSSKHVGVGVGEGQANGTKYCRPVTLGDRYTKFIIPFFQLFFNLEFSKIGGGQSRGNRTPPGNSNVYQGVVKKEPHKVDLCPGFCGTWNAWGLVRVMTFSSWRGDKQWHHLRSTLPNEMVSGILFGVPTFKCAH